MFKNERQIHRQCDCGAQDLSSEEAFHALFTKLRREDPVHWTEPDEYRPFWTVSKHADISEIEKQIELFINDPRLTLTTIEAEENLKSLEAKVNALAKEYIDRMEALGGACDFARDVAVWYPLRVIMTVLGVPPEDEGFMLKLTQEIFGATAPEMKREDAATEFNNNTITDFFNYFGAITADRRKNPKDDVASVIANAKINGELVSDFEALSCYIVVATAGHDTTSSTTAGGLLALMQNPAEFAKLRANPELLSSAVDEMIRWVTPVKNFFRTATQDVEFRGKKIRKGDNLLMCYWSGNRDEEVFDDPFAFKVDRNPNRHIAFGYGAHLCLGQHLAKMEIRSLYRELLSRLDTVELAGDPAWIEANFVSGLKRLPIRYSMKRKAA